MADLLEITPAPPGEEVLDFLESQLAKAREGSISAVAVAYVYRDGTTGSAWSVQHNVATMLGSLDALKAKLLKGMVE